MARRVPTDRQISFTPLRLPMTPASTPFSHPTHRGIKRAFQVASRMPVAIFLRELVANPREVGAVWPSSRQLAKRIAAAVPCDGQGKVIELGGGTGAVTEALLTRGIPPERLVVIERAPTLAALLRVRFPGVQVVEGDAMHLTDLLRDEKGISVIVSGLPLRSLPPRVVATIIREVSEVLEPGGLFVQFTYLMRPQRSISQRFAAISSRLVLGNIPPARVWAFVNQRRIRQEITT
ncbi:phosphatidylethanolamine/phosphatidyl-N-methylethanolamine N-methyltransferase [Gammaproteobacteria bacterium]